MGDRINFFRTHPFLLHWRLSIWLLHMHPTPSNWGFKLLNMCLFYVDSHAALLIFRHAVFVRLSQSRCRMTERYCSYSISREFESSHIQPGREWPVDQWWVRKIVNMKFGSVVILVLVFNRCKSYNNSIRSSRGSCHGFGRQSRWPERGLERFSMMSGPPASLRTAALFDMFSRWCVYNVGGILDCHCRHHHDISLGIAWQLKGVQKIDSPLRSGSPGTRLGEWS